MLDFITRFFRREEASRTLAKERLRLVLMSDRVSLAPETFDEMKGEMLAVIRRYLDIDERALDMHFENLEKQFALLASIPVLKVRTPDEVAAWRQTPRQMPLEAVTGANGAAAARLLTAESPRENGSAAGHAGSGNGAASPQPRRRRRRRRSAPPPPASPDAPPPA
jgi:cell division topological specificity factor